MGRVVKMGAHGVKLALLTWVSGDVFTPAASYRLEIDHPQAGLLHCVGDLRSVSLSGVGFELQERLPDGLLRDARLGAAPPVGSATPAGPAASRETRRVLQQLAALIRSWRPVTSEVGQRSIGEALDSLVLDAFAQAALREWEATGRTLTDIERVTRLAVRMEELPVAHFATIQTVLRAMGELVGPRDRDPSAVAREAPDRSTGRCATTRDQSRERDS
ncbi:MAG: hypothetical protein HY217_05375 [Candidatus Rokubacteria bacterium]|nr:hypothetical protein [Candidatus Rokubacteria bacterium]